jgi:type I restriction enzyme M protein
VLTPGRYVGAADVADDDELFEEKMERLVLLLSKQFTSSDQLALEIKSNLANVGYRLE